MNLGVAINSEPTVWTNGALFMVVSVVAGHGSEVASLSAGGRDSAGKQAVWVTRSLRRGDRLSLVVNEQQSPRDTSSTEEPDIFPADSGKKISGFLVRAAGRGNVLVGVGEHETLQAVATCDVLSGYFSLEAAALTSSDAGYTFNGDSFSHGQPLGNDFQLAITVV
ncbi:hypothetical protein [Luteibacter sahnii]|uniref:hypothetical protein n=1 Tax=Luteibacter sahnii TaxID=3021977 RepID=UPI002A69ACE1|nr:hypothetical protein [Luteibacter sp. PPL193]MDY1547575.1 hypothetical protein [Luteibacter sp. PPL193]